MCIIIACFMGDLRALHIRGPEKLLCLVQTEIKQIFGKCLAALLGENG